MQSIILSAIKRHYNALLHPLHKLKHYTYVLFYEMKNKIQLVFYRQFFKILTCYVFLANCQLIVSPLSYYFYNALCKTLYYF